MQIERIFSGGMHHIVVWVQDEINGDFYVSSRQPTDSPYFTFRKTFHPDDEAAFKAMFPSAEFKQFSASQRVVLSQKDMAMLMMVAETF